MPCPTPSPTERASRFRRARTPAVLGLAAAFALGGTLVAGAAPNDPCDAAYAADGTNTAKLKAYTACREDRQDATLAQIQAQLKAMSPSGAPTATPSPTPPATPKPTPTASPTTSTPPSATPTSSPPSTAVLNLPRVPWSGGPAYYKPFPKAQAYTNPNVFPVGIFYNNFENDSQVAYDVDHGINFHVEGSNKGTNAGDYSAGICFTQDELDGRNSDRDAVVRSMSASIKACSDAGRVPYTNYTGFVTSDYGSTNNAYAKQLINLGGAMSVDGYYYTDPSCDNAQRTDYQIGSPNNAHCARSASYGNFIKNLRSRDDAPGVPLLGFVENGAPNDKTGKTIKPEQMDGAVWSVINNGSNGVIYFNNSFSGPCVSGAVLRDAQNNPNGCYKTISAQMKTTNAAIQAFAPVLNTQSYAWDFKVGVPTDTMLKVKDGQAYVFASVGVNGDSGSRTFTLPSGVSGNTVEVVGEGRSLPVSGGKFTDGFAAEYSHHVYKLNVG